MTLYLKYRPKDFDSLVWQDFIKDTLRQAILKDKLVWAYLFCWPRWTGKTSTARIFAKAINCLNLKNWNPCLECEICKQFNDESLVDIIEIDAASYTWVDNIRDIIDKACFSPTKCKYKVYIIDEVHMLSKWAFNALLKILEEPPQHLKFILATTEIQKIPETILSRCQRFDFKSINNEDLKNRLKYISEKENVKIDEESLNFILKQANWWLRNAISLFEQLIYNWEINFDNVTKNFSIPKTETLEIFYNKLLNKDPALIDDFENISSENNLNLFFKELLFFIRDKLLSNITNKELTRSNIYILDTLEESYIKARNSFDQKTTFLVWIVKIISEFSSIPNFETQNKIQNNLIETKKTIKKDTEITKEISFEDVQEVFWEAEQQENTEKPSEITQNNQTNNNFDVEKFIIELKNLWAKWALTMSIRWSSLNFDGKKLTIHTKTKISLKQILTSDNISLLTNALQNLWFLDVNIEVK